MKLDLAADRRIYSDPKVLVSCFLIQTFSLMYFLSPTRPFVLLTVRLPVRRSLWVVFLFSREISQKRIFCSSGRAAAGFWLFLRTLDEHLNCSPPHPPTRMSFLPSECCMRLCELNPDLIGALPATSVPIEMHGVMFNHHKRDLRQPG